MSGHASQNLRLQKRCLLPLYCMLILIKSHFDNAVSEYIELSVQRILKNNRQQMRNYYVAFSITIVLKKLYLFF